MGRQHYAVFTNLFNTLKANLYWEEIVGLPIETEMQRLWPWVYISSYVYFSLVEYLKENRKGIRVATKRFIQVLRY